MTVDLSKLPRHVLKYKTSGLAACPTPVSITAEDWVGMFRAFDIHVDLYCASSNMGRSDALEALNEKLAKSAASFPDALACMERERARNEVPLYVQLSRLKERK
jgi:hypothetical protein